MQHIEQAAQTQQTFGERWAERVGRAAARKPRAPTVFFTGGACFLTLILLPFFAPHSLAAIALGVYGISAGSLLLIIGWTWRTRRDYWRIVERERPGARSAAAVLLDPKQARRERRLVKDGRAAQRSPHLLVMSLLLAPSSIRLGLFWYGESSDAAWLMLASSALAALMWLWIALIYVEAAAFSRIIERQRAGAGEQGGAAR